MELDHPPDGGETNNSKFQRRPQSDAPSKPQRPRTPLLHTEDEFRSFLPPLPSRAIINPIPPPLITFLNQPTDTHFLVQLALPPYEHSDLQIDMKVDNGDWKPCQLPSNSQLFLDAGSITFFRSRATLGPNKLKYSPEISKGPVRNVLLLGQIESGLNWVNSSCNQKFTQSLEGIQGFTVDVKETMLLRLITLPPLVGELATTCHTLLQILQMVVRVRQPTTTIFIVGGASFHLPPSEPIPLIEHITTVISCVLLCLPARLSTTPSFQPLLDHVHLCHGLFMPLFANSNVLFVLTDCSPENLTASQLEAASIKDQLDFKCDVVDYSTQSSPNDPAWERITKLIPSIPPSFFYPTTKVPFPSILGPLKQQHLEELSSALSKANSKISALYQSKRELLTSLMSKKKLQLQMQGNQKTESHWFCGTNNQDTAHFFIPTHDYQISKMSWNCDFDLILEPRESSDWYQITCKVHSKKKRNEKEPHNWFFRICVRYGGKSIFQERLTQINNEITQLEENIATLDVQIEQEKESSEWTAFEPLLAQKSMIIDLLAFPECEIASVLPLLQYFFPNETFTADFGATTTETERISHETKFQRAQASLLIPAQLKSDWGTNIWEQYDTSVRSDDQGELIESGTLNSILQRLATVTEMKNLNAFLMTLNTFVTPDILLKKLQQLFIVPQEKDNQTKRIVPCWDADLVQTLQQMMEQIDSPVFLKKLQRSLDQLSLQKSTKNLDSLKSMMKGSAPGPDLTEAVLKSPLEIARQMTLVAHYWFCRIQSYEVLGLRWLSPEEKHNCLNVHQCIHFFGSTSSWVTKSILTQTNQELRVQLYNSFVEIAQLSISLRSPAILTFQECYRLKNFSSCFAIISALSHPAIDRLKLTKSLLKPETLTAESDLQSLIDATNSYKNYRDALSNATLPAVPHLGVFLEDLMAIEERNPLIINEYQINFKRCRLVSQLISRMQDYQGVGYQLQAIPIFQRKLQANHTIEDLSLLALSFELEPQAIGIKETEAVSRNIRPCIAMKWEIGLKKTWGPREIEALQKPLTTGACARVVVIRHGQGNHNIHGGAVSCVNRDARLNALGIMQAKLAGDALRTNGYIGDTPRHRQELLIVVSPFTRTIMTSIEVMGVTNWGVPTVIAPIVAEHTLIHSNIQRGDRGSKRETLEREFSGLSQFDFRPIDDYCKKNGIAGGKWWHHSKIKHYEEWEEFENRAKKMREWLASQLSKKGVKKCLLVSHGGVLRTAFETSLFDNCEFRVFDIYLDGSFTRVAEGESSRAKELSPLLSNSLPVSLRAHSQKAMELSPPTDTPQIPTRASQDSLVRPNRPSSRSPLALEELPSSVAPLRPKQAALPSPREPPDRRTCEEQQTEREVPLRPSSTPSVLRASSYQPQVTPRRMAPSPPTLPPRSSQILPPPRPLSDSTLSAKPPPTRPDSLPNEIV